MANDTHAGKIDGGFIGVTAVILLASGTIAFSLVVLGSAVLYADSVDRRELRIQADLNAKACLDSAALMAVKDYFLSGQVHISEFDCDAVIARDGAGAISVVAQAALNGVRSSILNEVF